MAPSNAERAAPALAESDPLEMDHLGGLICKSNKPSPPLSQARIHAEDAWARLWRKPVEVVRLKRRAPSKRPLSFFTSLNSKANSIKTRSLSFFTSLNSKANSIKADVVFIPNLVVFNRQFHKSPARIQVRVARRGRP